MGMDWFRHLLNISRALEASSSLVSNDILGTRRGGGGGGGRRLLGLIFVPLRGGGGGGFLRRGGGGGGTRASPLAPRVCVGDRFW